MKGSLIMDFVLNYLKFGLAVQRHMSYESIFNWAMMAICSTVQHYYLR